MNFDSIHLNQLCLYFASQLNISAISQKDFASENTKDLIEAAKDQGLLTVGGEKFLNVIKDSNPEFDKDYYFNVLKKYEFTALQSSARLLRIINILKSENISAVPVKGPLLSQYLYGDISKRTFADFDIFIFQKDLYRAVHILQKHGYIPDLDLNEKKMSKFSSQEYDFQLYNQDSHTLIELHWELSGRYTKYPMTLDNYFYQLQWTDFLSKKILKLPDHTEFIYLCIHSGKHCYEKLEMLFSIALYYQKFSDQEFDFILQRSSIMRCRKIVLFSIYLCVSFFDLKVSQKVSEEIKKYKDFEAIKEKMIYFIEHKNSLTKTRFSNVHMSLQESLFLKIALRCRLIFTPTCKEWSIFKLPLRLSFLYYFLRPLRLAFAYFL